MLWCSPLWNWRWNHIRLFSFSLRWLASMWGLRSRWLLTQRLHFYPHGGLRTLRVLYGHNKLLVSGLPDLFKRLCTFSVHGDMIHACFDLLFLTWTCLSNRVLLSQRHWKTKRENNLRFSLVESPKMYVQVRLPNVQRRLSRNLTLYLSVKAYEQKKKKKKMKTLTL